MRSSVPPEFDVRQCDILDLCLVCVRVRQGGERPRRDLEGSKKLYSMSRHDAMFCMAIAVLRRCNFNSRLDFRETFSKKNPLILACLMSFVNLILLLSLSFVNLILLPSPAQGRRDIELHVTHRALLFLGDATPQAIASSCKTSCARRTSRCGRRRRDCG